MFKLVVFSSVQRLTERRVGCCPDPQDQQRKKKKSSVIIFSKSFRNPRSENLISVSFESFFSSNKIFKLQELSL